MRSMPTGLCSVCREPLFDAWPGKTTKQEIIAFAKKSKLPGAESIARDGWIHPGTYCPNGCTCILVNVRRPDTEPNGESDLLLSRAAEMGDTRQVERLLDSGANINAANRAGWTALSIACQHEKPKVVRLLLERGADLTIGRSTDNNTGKNSLDCRYTPIFIAAEAGLTDIVSLLLDSGADPDVALWVVAGCGNLAMMRMVIGRSADIDAVRWDYTVLMKAIAHKQVEAMRLLLEAGTNIDIQVPSTGRTALMRAVEQNHLPSLSLLLEYRPNAELKNKKGETAIDVAGHWGKASTIEMLAVYTTDR